MKTTIPFSIVLAFLFVTLLPQAQATCQNGCLTDDNTVLGEDALVNNTTGIDNTAVGFNALKGNTTAQANTAIGSQTLVNSTTGGGNTATGALALQLNTTGSDNTATGVFALEKNTTGSDNTAVGLFAAFSNTMGTRNTVNGWEAFFANTGGSSNTVTGTVALGSNTTGNANTAVGDSALAFNTTGSGNIALGVFAGGALTTGSKNVDIANRGVAGEANTIRIGTAGNQSNTFIAGISGATVPTGVPVVIDTTGHLGTTTSAARFKEAIEPMDRASEAILALKPVTFRYKHEVDPVGIPQFGLVAEQVEKMDPDLVARDEQGKPYTVRYDAVNAMLLNEFLKEHRRVESLEKAMAEQQNDNAIMRAMLKEQAAQIQKVSAELELNRSAPQTVLNDQ